MKYFTENEAQINKFVECKKCASKPGTPVLCSDCLKRRSDMIYEGKAEMSEEAKIKEYKIVTSRKFSELEQIVNGYILSDWEPIGGIQIGGSDGVLVVAQSMIKRHDII